ncbi:glycoside hydrolase family 71 protein [Lentinula guzmanii]|uniref:Glycoside hydrolase family 71 protein n=1 Tax=Lentinula guzmanii TaxID=2804957 RepID=A0AA38JKQ6_9AGAR|nr:glycoside hydrolase family 71 protein [Lentinula guzmanii]
MLSRKFGAVPKVPSDGTSPQVYPSVRHGRRMHNSLSALSLFMPLAGYIIPGLQILSLSFRVDAKDVFAHFMVQNSYSYTKSDWAADISAAQAIGIDGFALNTAVDSYEQTKYPDAFAAAQAADFDLFISFDMTYEWETTDMVNLVKQYASSSNYYKWEGKPLVSTFGGDSDSNDFWTTFKIDLANAGISISLAPAFVDYREPDEATQMFSNFTAIDGFFNWWSWPADENANLTTDTDLAYKKALSSAGRSGPYIMSVSPWQFKELGDGQDWVEQCDTLWEYRWKQAIHDVEPDIVEILTWNDYGESHYISDINPIVNLGDLAPLYVNGFDHSGWRTMAKYYISWFKNGTAPAIEEDKVIYWYRVHPKSITCSQGALPRNSQFPEDAVFAFSMLKSSANISLTIGESTTTYDSGKGVAIGSVPFSQKDGQKPVIKIMRDGQTVKSGTGSKTINTTNCDYYNFNTFVGVV